VWSINLTGVMAVVHRGAHQVVQRVTAVLGRTMLKPGHAVPQIQVYYLHGQVEKA